MKRFFKFLFLLILISAILLLGAVFLFINRYNTWEKEFEQSLVSSNLVIPGNPLEQDIEEKIVRFTLSAESTDSLVLTTREVGELTLVVLQDYLKEDIQVSKIYIEPNSRVWNIYAKVNYRKLSLWMSVDVNKDNMQTAQLYITEVKIGPYSIGRVGNMIEMINSGIANSLLTVNENGFSGRYLENIELLEDALVIKGYRY
ncbi:MAG: hypothetical protein RBT33_00280 [Candidatus Dojkabacteria bacterium]|nr:hypothetical protein [Candidatus Dojkabacteria bacterium]